MHSALSRMQITVMIPSSSRSSHSSSILRLWTQVQNFQERSSKSWSHLSKTDLLRPNLTFKMQSFGDTFLSPMCSCSTPPSLLKTSNSRSTILSTISHWNTSRCSRASSSRCLSQLRVASLPNSTKIARKCYSSQWSMTTWSTVSPQLSPVSTKCTVWESSWSLTQALSSLWACWQPLLWAKSFLISQSNMVKTKTSISFFLHPTTCSWMVSQTPKWPEFTLIRTATGSSRSTSLFRSMLKPGQASGNRLEACTWHSLLNWNLRRTRKTPLTSSWFSPPKT